MTYEEFNRKFRNKLQETAGASPVTDEEIYKLYLSHYIIVEWQHKQLSKKITRKSR